MDKYTIGLIRKLCEKHDFFEEDGDKFKSPLIEMEQIGDCITLKFEDGTILTNLNRG